MANNQHRKSKIPKQSMKTANSKSSVSRRQYQLRTPDISPHEDPTWFNKAIEYIANLLQTRFYW